MIAATTQRRRSALLAAFVAAVLVAVVLSLMIGRQQLSPATVLTELFAPTHTSATDIVRGLRLDRTLVGLLVGVALGGAGALMQALTRNPLADPGILGVNAGAAAAVATGVVFFGIGTTQAQMWLAFAGAAAISVVVYAIGTGGSHGTTPARLALAGAAVTAILIAYTNGLSLRSQESYNEMRFWVVGSVVNRDLGMAAQALGFIAVGVVIALAVAPSLNALALGSDTGRSLGVNVTGVRIGTAVAITLLCGAATAIAGPIGFVGLTVPHVARMFFGPDQRWVIPVSMVLAALLVLLADTAGRVVGHSRELEVSIMTAVLGAPVFIALVRRRRLVTA